jgi:DHA1 family bicyclomycin/chloramphenicol resistance-like MFS transporter
LRLGLGVQLLAASSLVLVVALGVDSLYTVVPLIMLFMGQVGLITPNAMSSMLEKFSHMSATATALLGSIQFSCGALAGVLVGAFEVESPWPMVLTMLGVSTLGNLGLRLLVGRKPHTE